MLHLVAYYYSIELVSLCGVSLYQRLYCIVFICSSLCVYCCFDMERVALAADTFPLKIITILLRYSNSTFLFYVPINFRSTWQVPAGKVGGFHSLVFY